MDNPSSPNSMTLEKSLYLLHHLFLPPKLPQTDDYNAEHEQLLLDSVIDALVSFRGYVPPADTVILSKVARMMVQLRKTHGPHGNIDEKQLEKALTELPTQDGFLPIHVREQNAGILLSCQSEAVYRECFELSPRNEPVMTTVGRLRRIFPGPTMRMNRESFDEPVFRELLAQTIARMSHQPVAGTKPKVKKAKQKHDEDRDTTHPKMVTEFLMSTLRPRCTDVRAEQIQKNTREEVLWLNCQSPWRRSALWLLVRVTLQLVFRRVSGEKQSNDLYKQFMIFFMTSIIDRVSTAMPTEAFFLMNAKIVRRLLKLDWADEPLWFTSVQNVLGRVSGATQDQWRNIVRGNSQSINMAPLSGLNFRHDIQCALPCLDRDLESIGKRSRKRLRGRDFQSQPKLIQYRQTELPGCFEAPDPDYQIYNLAALENWVASYLNPWMEIHQGEEATCGQLGDVMIQYFQRASTSYLNNPEATSIMLLTLLELWIACDKSAIHLHPALREYDTYIPVDCFQSLLLPFRSQMDRLACAEGYLTQRQAQLSPSGSNIFRDFGTSSCFAVRYFDQSSEHQQLLAAIEEHAN